MDLVYIVYNMNDRVTETGPELVGVCSTYDRALIIQEQYTELYPYYGNYIMIFKIPMNQIFDLNIAEMCV